MDTKICFKCKVEKELECFYRHPQMKDGHLNKCIGCSKKDTIEKQKSLRLDPIWVENERKRGREKYHRLEYKGKHYPTKERKKEIIRKYNQKYPEKALARKYTEIFLTKIKDKELHHWSYNQEDWLDIIELDLTNHHEIHRFIRYDQETMFYKTLTGTLLDTKQKHLEYINLHINKD